MAEVGAFDGTADVESATQRLLAQEITFEEFTEAFMHGRLWFKKGAEVGFQAVGKPGEGFVPVFSSELALATAEGECEWASTTGMDLIRLMPPGYGLLMDYGRETELVIVFRRDETA